MIVTKGLEHGLLNEILRALLVAAELVGKMMECLQLREGFVGKERSAVHDGWLSEV